MYLTYLSVCSMYFFNKAKNRVKFVSPIFTIVPPVNVIGCGGVQGALQEARWDQVHDQRLPLLQLGSDHERGGCRGYREDECEGVEDWMDEHEP